MYLKNIASYECSFVWGSKVQQERCTQRIWLLAVLQSFQRWARTRYRIDRALQLKSNHSDLRTFR